MKTATASLHISLPTQLKSDVQEQVKKGRYSNPTDYVRQLIRQDILREKAREEFSAFIKEGVQSPDNKQSPEEMFAEIKAGL